MRRAIEESKRQADEDERKRRAALGETDEDIAKAIKLSKEDEELRQSRLENQNANLLFDDTWDQPAQQQSIQQQPVYQQQQEVDFWGNPVDMNAQQQQQQSTGYLTNVYSQPTGFLPQQQTGYMQPQPTAVDGFNNGYPTNNPYIQSQPQQQFTQQQTGFPSSPIQTTMSNNPYAQQSPEPLQPMPTGSNNPFAQITTSQQSPQQTRPAFSPSLSTLSEQQQQQQPQYPTTLSPQNTFTQPNPSFSTPPKQQSTHQNKLDFLLSQGNPTGQDTFGNTGELRVPAHYQRTGYINSSGQGLRPSITGVPSPNNPFFTGQQQGGQVRPLTQSTTGPAYGTQSSSPFGQYGQQNQQAQTGSLIDF
jgi:epsin